MKPNIFIFILGISSLFSCLNDSQESNDSHLPPPSFETQSSTAILVNPYLYSDTIALVKANTPLWDLNKTSNFLTPLYIADSTYIEPWIRVKNANQQEGWIYLAHIKIDQQIRIQKSVQALFPDPFPQKLKQYQASIDTLITNEAHLHQRYTQALELKDTINSLLFEALDHPAFDTITPNLFWIKDYFPGFTPMLVAEGTAYQFFTDYKFWLSQAQQTEGQSDDQFFNIQCALFPIDSVEYYFPSYYLQTWDYGGHSLLGRNIHMSLLAQINEALASENNFEKELLSIKEKILDDICMASNTYWEEQSLIITEIETIIEPGLDILNIDDLIMLKERKKQFEKYKEYGIQLNLQSGMIQE